MFPSKNDDSISGTDADAYDMLLKPEDFTNTNENFAEVVFVIVDGQLVIDPIEVVISTGSATMQYNGTALTNDEADITGLVAGESVTLTATGSQTEIGKSKNTYDIVWDNAKESNYTVKDLLGDLEVTTNINDNKITLTAATDSKTYDGTALENSAVEATGLPEGFTAEASATGSQCQHQQCQVIAEGSRE